MDYSKLEATVASVLATPYEDERVHELAQVLAEVLAASTLQPCHLLTSAHGEEHHTRGGVCEHMLGATATRVATALGTPVEGLPPELHSQEECEKCYVIPEEQAKRDRLIANWEWAGLKPTAAMRELAPDAVHPGDDELLLALLTPRFQGLHSLVGLVGEALPGVTPSALHRRFGKVIHALAKQGKVEHYDGFFRLVSAGSELPTEAPYPGQRWAHRETHAVSRIFGLKGPAYVALRHERDELTRITRADLYQDFIFVSHS